MSIEHVPHMERWCCVNIHLVQTVAHTGHHMNTPQTEHCNELKVEGVHMEISVYINLLHTRVVMYVQCRVRIKKKMTPMFGMFFQIAFAAQLQRKSEGF